MADPTPDNRTTSLEAEHRAMLAQVVEIRRSLDGAAFRPLSPAWRQEQEAKLGALMTWLQDHFEREEGLDGFYARAAAARQDLSLEIARLRDQHRIFLSWGKDLLAEAGREEGDLLSLREGLLAYFRLLARHEAREQELQVSLQGQGKPGPSVGE